MVAYSSNEKQLEIMNHVSVLVSTSWVIFPGNANL